ncbi:hypothetical protein [Halomonas sp. QHL1]|uniref:hypothetical protein n=1 Tax=Halomonas sp. QHL1 TaxID=1123773 RepID=UPI0008FCF5CD|nr:hypothetical protein [Halomonas sp. QHL1]OJA03883.1 hypothetical protein QHL1GM_18800 [Halomonas sp. QHL1]
MTLDLNLHKRLKEQFAQESATIQTATQQQLGAMRRELQGIYSGVLSTIEADMQQETKLLAKRFRNLMLLPSLLLVMISLGICAAAWAFTQYQWGQIQEQRVTLDRLQTLGVETVKTESGKGYLILPKGAGLSEIRITQDTERPFVEIQR